MVGTRKWEWKEKTFLLKDRDSVFILVNQVAGANEDDNNFWIAIKGPEIRELSFAVVVNKKILLSM